MKPLMIALLLLAFPAAALAQQSHQSHDMAGHEAGMQQHTTSTSILTEAGQDAFATISEIVQLLESDPETDWSKVSIDALREHLVDMNEVTLNSATKTIESENSIGFNVTGVGRTIVSIQRMVTAHAPMLAAETGWSVDTNTNDEGATMTITTSNKTELEKIKALGFYGVMTIGAHHQMHHLMMATGMNPH